MFTYTTEKIMCGHCRLEIKRKERMVLSLKDNKRYHYECHKIKYPDKKFNKSTQ